MKGFLNISEAVLIAMHGLIIIAKEKNSMASSKLISNMTGASYNTVSKVMQRLVKARMIESERGPNGGFSLTQPTSSVSLYDIYKVIEGEPDIKDCLFDSLECPMGGCIFGDTIGKISNDFKQFLMERNLSHYSN